MLFLNTRNKQNPLHRKVRMLNPSISASMGLNSISRAKEGMVIVMPTPGGSHTGLSKAWGIPRSGSPPSLIPTNKREPEAHSSSYQRQEQRQNKCLRPANSLNKRTRGSEESTPQRAKALKKISKWVRTFHLIPRGVWSWQEPVE